MDETQKKEDEEQLRQLRKTMMTPEQTLVFEYAMRGVRVGRKESFLLTFLNGKGDSFFAIVVCEPNHVEYIEKAFRRMGAVQLSPLSVMPIPKLATEPMTELATEVATDEV